MTSLRHDVPKFIALYFENRLREAVRQAVLKSFSRGSSLLRTGAFPL